MEHKIIRITYNFGENRKTDIIEEETEQYIYFTDGWLGIKKRWDRQNNILAQQLRNGDWQAFLDNDKITQVEIY